MRFRLLVLFALLGWLLGAETHPHVRSVKVEFGTAVIQVETLEYTENEEPASEVRDWTVDIGRAVMGYAGETRQFDDPRERPLMLQKITVLRMLVEDWLGVLAESVKIAHREDWTVTFRSSGVDKIFYLDAFEDSFLIFLRQWIIYTGESVMWWIEGKGIPLESPRRASNAYITHTV